MTTKNILVCFALISQMVCLNTSNELKNTTGGEKKLERFIVKYMPNPLIVTNKKYFDLTLEMEHPRILYNLNKKLLNSFGELGKNHSYVIIEDKENLKSAIKVLSLMENFNSRQRFLIALKNGTQDDVSQTVLLLWQYYIYNVIIYVNNGDFYIWYPYDKRNSCGKLANIVKIGKKDPFTNKIPWKLNNCSLRVSWNFLTIILEDPFTENNPGALFRVMDIIGRKMTANFEYLRNNTDYMEHFMNFNNYNILIDDMIKREIDMAPILGLEHKCQERNKNDLEETDTIETVGLYFLLPPRKRIDPDIYVVNMFSPTLLLCIIGTLLLAMFIFKLLSKQRWSILFLKMFQVNMQQSFVGVPSSNAMRIMLITYLFYNTCIYTAWQTVLSSLLTSPRYQPKVDTFEQLVHTDLKIEGDNMIYCSLVYTDSGIASGLKKKLINPNRGKQHVIVTNFLKNPQCVVPINSISLFQFKDREKLEVITRDQVNTVHYRMAVRKGFPLLEKLNYWINEIKERGIVKKLITDQAKKIFYSDNYTHRDKVPLGLVHLKGAFVILLCGLGVSCLVFFMELLVFYKH